MHGLPANPNPGFEQRALAATIHVFNKIGANLKDSGRQVRLQELRGKLQTKESYGVRFTGAEKALHPAAEPDIYGMRSFFGLEFQRVAKQDVKDNMTSYTRLVNFAKRDVKFGSLFTASPTEPPAAPDPLHYGLVVESITPDYGAPSFAALNDSQDDMAEELRHAGQAKVAWGVAADTEGPPRRLFAAAAPSSGADASDDGGRYHLKLPSTNFHTDASTDSSEDVTKIDPRALPSIRLRMVQEDGYYTLSYTTSAQGKRSGEQHTFRLPVAGSLALGQRFDDHFRTLETSAYSILYDSRLPTVNLHQLNVERRQTADLSKQLRGHHTIGITAQTPAKAPTVPVANRGKSLAVNYRHDF